MRFHDPARPLMHSRPCYIDSAGRRVYPLPDIGVVPDSDPGMFSIRVWLKFRAEGYTVGAANGLTIARVSEFLLQYQNDPEETLRVWFSYEGASVAQAAELNLGDLGL